MGHKLDVLLKLPEMLHEPRLSGELLRLPAGGNKVCGGQHHRANEHVGIDEIVVDHEQGLLELGLGVEDEVHLLAAFVAKLHYLAEQIETTLDRFFLPKY